jgi:hypothetical protein
VRPREPRSPAESSLRTLREQLSLLWLVFGREQLTDAAEVYEATTETRHKRGRREATRQIGPEGPTSGPKGRAGHHARRFISTLSKVSNTSISSRREMRGPDTRRVAFGAYDINPDGDVYGHLRNTREERGHLGGSLPWPMPARGVCLLDPVGKPYVCTPPCDTKHTLT